jgi:hypothetical protein
VVDGELTLRPTGSTPRAVAIDDGLPVAGEAAAGMGLPPVTGGAQAGTQGRRASPQVQKSRAYPRGEKPREEGGGGKPGEAEESATSPRGRTPIHAFPV